jgi:hypothetical protein
MAPHPPPCFPNEVLWGNTCYPRIDTFRIEKVGVDYKFILDEVPGDLLPDLADKAGDQAHLHVKKAGPAFGVTITSIPHGDATGLLRQLRPDDPNIKLPD